MANADGVWQGRSDSALSPLGEEQLLRLVAADQVRPGTLVVSSPLGRARSTAAILGDFDVDERWAEIDLGDWDGLTRAEVIEGYPAEAAELAAGNDVTPPGGESTGGFTDRLDAALSDLADRLGDGGHAIVVTHGGAVYRLVSRLLGLTVSSRLHFPGNTAATTIRVDGTRRGVLVYNDAAHLDGRHRPPRPGVTNVLLFRHGETSGNVTERWQGRSEGQLTAIGRRQAEVLGSTAPPFTRLYSSPLVRARETAAVVAEQRGLDVELVADLVEMDFGRWENLTASEAEARDPELFDIIFRQGRDLARGGTGERFADAGVRVAEALSGLVATNGASTIAAVGHGGATRAFVSHLLGLDFSDRHRLGPLRNTAMVAVSYREGQPSLAAYNVAPHLGA